MTFSFTNYAYKEITKNFGFADKVPDSELILNKIAMISSLVNDSCQENATTLGFP